jgi:hypothetical protein
MTIRRKISEHVLAHPNEFPREDNQTLKTEKVNDDLEFREFILNSLKNLKSKKKTLTRVFRNSNNHTDFSTLWGKSEAIEFRFGFMGIEGSKFLFKWLRYSNWSMNF